MAELFGQVCHANWIIVHFSMTSPLFTTALAVDSLGQYVQVPTVERVIIKPVHYPNVMNKVKILMEIKHSDSSSLKLTNTCYIRRIEEFENRIIL